MYANQVNRHRLRIAALLTLFTATALAAPCPATVAAEETVPSWTNQAGSSVTAEFVGLDASMLTLRKDGRAFTIPLSALSEDSQRQARELAAKSSAQTTEVNEEPITDVASTPGQISPAQLAALWDDLLEAPPVFSRALLRLANDPEATTEFLRAQLKPAEITREKLDDLLMQLASEDEDVWMHAQQQLRYFDPRLAMNIEALFALETVQDFPTRHRLADVLIDSIPPDAFSACDYKFVKVGRSQFIDARGDYSICISNQKDACDRAFQVHSGVEELNGLNQKPEWTRAVCALRLLQSFETPAADAIIADMASGHSFAQPTRIARAILAASNR